MSSGPDALRRGPRHPGPGPAQRRAGGILAGEPRDRLALGALSVAAMIATLHDTIQALVTWTEEHQSEIAAARAAYDAREKPHTPVAAGV